MVPAMPPAELENDEARSVYLWRRRCFLQDGFSWDQAVRLAKHGADHHEAEVLLGHGCSKDLVYRLLR